MAGPVPSVCVLQPTDVHDVTPPTITRPSNRLFKDDQESTSRSRIVPSNLVDPPHSRTNSRHAHSTVRNRRRCHHGAHDARDHDQMECRHCRIHSPIAIPRQLKYTTVHHLLNNICYRTSQKTKTQYVQGLFYKFLKVTHTRFLHEDSLRG